MMQSARLKTLAKPSRGRVSEPPLLGTVGYLTVNVVETAAADEPPIET